MDREELIRLAGEQALLRKDVTEITAAFNRDKRALLDLYHTVDGGHAATGWLPDAITLLTRLHENQIKLGELHRRLCALAQLTGL